MNFIKWLLLAIIAKIAVGIIVPIAIPIQIVYRLFSKKYDVKYYVEQLTDALHKQAVADDITIGSALYGSKHTLSALNGYYATKRKLERVTSKIIDALFGKEHCKKEAEDEGLIPTAKDYTY